MYLFCLKGDRVVLVKVWAVFEYILTIDSIQMVK